MTNTQNDHATSNASASDMPQTPNNPAPDHTHPEMPPTTPMPDTKPPQA